MKCLECKRQMARDWLFCPYDGTELEAGSGLPEIINKVVNGIKKFSRGSGEPVNMGGFTIKIKTGPDEKIIASGPINMGNAVIDLDKSAHSLQKSSSSEQRPRLQISGAIEPKTDVKRHGNELELVIELPGVKSLNEIDLAHLGESLEIRANAKGKGYFKILSVPEEYKIINKSISNGVLLVRMSDKGLSVRTGED